MSNWIVSGDESSKPPADAGRPWPPLGPDTPWWRESADADAKPSEGTRDDPAAAASRSASKSASPPPTRRVTNVGPEGFPQRQSPLAPPPPAPSPPVSSPPVPSPEAAAADAASDLDPVSWPDGEDAPPIGVLAGFPTTPDDDDEAWPAGSLKPPMQRRFRPMVATGGRRPPKHPRKPALGLTGLLFFALVSAFLSWYAAGPIWLSLGHGQPGVATVVSCPVNGLSRRCADFVAEDNAFTARVALLGPVGTRQAVGTRLPAQMVNADASTAYVGDGTSLYRRWGPSVALLVLCGFGIAWATGASRLPRTSARWTARLASLIAPALLLAGMLAATY